jgi:hypothetical protein
MSNLQIPNLPAAVALSGTEQFEAVQAGTSVKVATAQLGAYIIAAYYPVSTSLTVGATEIAGGDTSRVLYNAAGVLGEYAVTGTAGSVVLSNSPVLTAPNIGAATGTSFNRVTITAPATTATLTLTDNSSLATVGAFATTLTTTANTSVTLPTAGTLATLDGAEALTNKTYNGHTWTAGSGTLTMGGNLVTSGAYNLTATLTANTSVTLPTTGTLATLAGSEALTNKTYNGHTWTAGSGTLTMGGDLITSGAYNLTATLTANTSVTLPTTGTLATLAGSEALTNKTYNGNTWTAGASTLTLAGNFITSGAHSLTATLTGDTNVTFPTTGTLAVVGDPVLEPFTSKTANYTITTTDSTVLCLTNSFTLTLPTAVGLTGRKFTVKNGNTLASGNDILMATTSSQTVDGSAPGALTPLTTQSFQSDGANWWII